MNRERTTSRHPLPDAWTSPQVIEDTFDADGLRLKRAGLSSTGPSGEEILGSAADVDGAPSDRAYFELLERVSTIEWLAHPSASCELLTREGEPRAKAVWGDVVPESLDPSRFRYARSNGVALHESWDAACQHALWELWERDRVLRAWYGASVPERLAEGVDDTPLTQTASYDWRAYAFLNTPDETLDQNVHVAGVFGFPRVETAPLVFGYGARASVEEARRTAAREAAQLLAFLWGEPISTGRPRPSPSPAYHLEVFQRREGHETLRRWLGGEHARFGSSLAESPRARARASVNFVDLTPRWLEGFRVAKAVCPKAIPLVFGEDPKASHLPRAIRVHPIA
jgi:YcaO cyclodehydratase, ATP-ad Mg2+-binding